MGEAGTAVTLAGGGATPAPTPTLPVVIFEDFFSRTRVSGTGWGVPPYAGQSTTTLAGVDGVRGYLNSPSGNAGNQMHVYLPVLDEGHSPPGYPTLPHPVRGWTKFELTAEMTLAVPLLTGTLTPQLFFAFDADIYDGNDDFRLFDADMIVGVYTQAQGDGAPFQGLYVSSGYSVWDGAGNEVEWAWPTGTTYDLGDGVWLQSRFRFRAQADAVGLRAKAWADNTQEPVAWQASLTHPDPRCWWPSYTPSVPFVEWTTGRTVMNSINAVRTTVDWWTWRGWM